MPKLTPISHRELARKLKRAGFVEIRTRRHPVYYLAEKDLTIPIPMHPGDVPKGTLRTIISRNANQRRGVQRTLMKESQSSIDSQKIIRRKQDGELEYL